MAVVGGGRVWRCLSVMCFGFMSGYMLKLSMRYTIDYASYCLDC